MVEQAAEILAEYIYDRIGHGLRTVVIIKNDDFDIHYLNDDLQQEYTKEGYREVVNTFRLQDPFLSPGLEGKPVGERRALVDYHENACIIQFPYSESEIILISISRDAGRDLVEFIESCRQIIKDNT
ncbi:hypothetical protein NDI56_21380 [Haloarcula sp. S1CR25-12]|uniref:Uncharacterized protein n=1 Tax=Haloarcula saliterrae TaxID=2950534 RepID=A0ABU2FJ44_9EURY|nr:hypothetical protein [Haloarcula sp. S1CR25-12]MDS0261963.1 hypothetical protein [Haloarcula sp. S1CR25-12]